MHGPGVIGLSAFFNLWQTLNKSHQRVLIAAVLPIVRKWGPHVHRASGMEDGSEGDPSGTEEGIDVGVAIGVRSNYLLYFLNREWAPCTDNRISLDKAACARRGSVDSGSIERGRVGTDTVAGWVEMRGTSDGLSSESLDEYLHATKTR
jgi:hypothetical protein